MQIRLISWAESCPCHWDLKDKAAGVVPEQLLRLCEACPMRGLRAAELAAGHFNHVLQELCEVSSANLLLNMPERLSQGDRATILHDFESGRAHILFQISLKTCHWDAFPWVSFGAACQDGPTAQRIVEETLACGCQHSQVAHVHEPQMADQLREFLSDPAVLFHSQDPEFLSHVRKWFARVRLVPIVERRIEGKHAASSKEVKRAPHHSCPYVSLLHRASEIKAALKAQPEFITPLAGKIMKARSGLAAVKLLNLDCHPYAQNGQHCRDPTYTKIVYHADSHVKYCMSQPQLFMDKPPPGEQHLPLAMQSHEKHLKHELAKKHAVAKFQEVSAQNTFFSMPVSSGALKVLKALLVPRHRTGFAPENALTQGPAALALDGDVDFSQQFCLTQLDSGPTVPDKLKQLVFWKLMDTRSAARARREKVEGEYSLTGCLAVTAHSVLHLHPEARELTVSLAPMNLTAASCDQVPLVFNPMNMTLEDLENVRVWSQTKEPIVYTFKFQYLHQLPKETLTQVPVLLQKLMDRPHGIHLGKPSQSMAALVACLCKDGLIEDTELTSSAGTSFTLKKLSEKGVELVEPCVVLGQSHKLCQRVHDADPLTKSTYEVLLDLEASGFKLKALSKKEVGKKKKNPFTLGAPPEFFSKEGTPTISHFYLVCLLLAEKHGQPVPHFQHDKVYKQLLGLCDDGTENKRTRKPKQLCIIGEHFCPESLVPDIPAQRKPKKQKTDLATVDLWEKDETMTQVTAASDNDDEEVASPMLPISSSSTSSSATSSSSSSDSSTSDSDSSSAEAEREQGGPDVDGKGEPPDVVEPPAHSEETQPSKAKTPVSKAKAKGLTDGKDLGSGPRTRGRFQAEPWGVYKVTFFDRKGSTGFQMLCTNPKHNPAGQSLCTKSRSDRFDGGADMSLRMLKQWAVQGQTVNSKAEHQSLWGSVLQDYNSKCVWEEEQLEASKIESWESHASSSAAPSSSARSSKRKLRD